MHLVYLNHEKQYGEDDAEDAILTQLLICRNRYDRQDEWVEYVNQIKVKSFAIMAVPQVVHKLHHRRVK